MRKKTTIKQLQKQCDAFNASTPIGTPVTFWPGVKEGPGRESRTRSEAWVIPSMSVVVSVEGYAGGIDIEHVQPLQLINYMPLSEQAGNIESAELANYIKEIEAPGILFFMDQKNGEPGPRIVATSSDEEAFNMVFSVLIGEPKWLEFFYDAAMNAFDYVQENGFTK